MSELAGKVVLVTGGSRGMGREMVHALAAEGADVVVASRRLPACEIVADEVRRAHGVRALPVALNTSDWDACTAVVDRVVDEMGGIDVLVNNAGSSPHYPSLDQVGEELFDKVIAVNLKGPFRLTALVGTRMAAGSGGSIINIGSIEAIRPHEFALPYAAAKAGLHVLTEGFAQAFGPRVRVNTIQPGAFLTDISERWPEGLREQMESQVALQRCAEPHEVVGAVKYLSTSASSYVTGAVLRIDGGWR
ncbi:SDR family NAD(P)-dependent oxidoreductase [Micromonospora olivasterospora]|uniref:NAD(P)-dependent dehydrogenase (Short-subunit alcohol dehydrogenase family) n=1 Tax=Micromonospora olivasterospora TaxID=1880 RepID=A0A562I2T6_MICOL|nr:SDR family NAD(P)-dependent oxidoreductase [Micromonospora olivasterospora]TWH65310.1 NAD(P)-dependent dehydrogenase (short-subunit alcohol dehydrogenase family) [Micromonospora olivasterospora]